MCLRVCVGPQMLTQLLDVMLERYQAMKESMGPRHLVRESQRIHSICLFEVVRQVSVHCIERGVLLKRVWEYVPRAPWAPVCLPGWVGGWVGEGGGGGGH